MSAQPTHADRDRTLAAIEAHLAGLEEGQRRDRGRVEGLERALERFAEETRSAISAISDRMRTPSSTMAAWAAVVLAATTFMVGSIATLGGFFVLQLEQRAVSLEQRIEAREARDVNQGFTRQDHTYYLEHVAEPRFAAHDRRLEKLEGRDG